MYWFRWPSSCWCCCRAVRRSRKHNITRSTNARIRSWIHNSVLQAQATGAINPIRIRVVLAGLALLRNWTHHTVTTVSLIVAVDAWTTSLTAWWSTNSMALLSIAGAGIRRCASCASWYGAAAAATTTSKYCLNSLQDNPSWWSQRWVHLVALDSWHWVSTSIHRLGREQWYCISLPLLEFRKWHDPPIARWISIAVHFEISCVVRVDLRG